MISGGRENLRFILGSASYLIRTVFTGGVLFAVGASNAANWDAGARLSTSGIYSDNINLSVANEQNEFVTQISPGASISGEGGRVQVNADYSLQISRYQEDPSRDRTNHRLSMKERAEVVKDLFYFDSLASISQQLEQPGGVILLDSMNLLSGDNDVLGLQLNPYLERDLGSLARGHVGYKYGMTRHESNSASDSEISTVRAELGNGHRNTLFQWSAKHRINRVMRDGAADSERTATSGMMSYRMFTTLTAIVNGGREKNVIETSNPNRDGSYWSAGLRWVPSPKFSLELTKGENEVRGVLGWLPQSRTSINLSYLDRDVGLSDSAVWSGQISHNTRRSTWSLNYTEAVTNVQALVFEQQSFFVGSQQGGLLFDPDTGQPVILTINVFSISDEEFLLANGQGAVSYRTGKSTIVGSLHSEVRTFEVSGFEETAVGGTASWNWKFASRTSSNTSVTTQRSDVASVGEPIQSLRVSLGLNRSMNHNMNTRLVVSRTESDVATTNMQAIENRIMATFEMTF